MNLELKVTQLCNDMKQLRQRIQRLEATMSEYERGKISREQALASIERRKEKAEIEAMQARAEIRQYVRESEGV